MGHARFGRARGSVLRGAPARRNRAQAPAHICGRSHVNPHDYEFLCKLLKDQSGLALAGDKQYLLESRLLPLVRKAGLASLADLVAKLKDGGDRLAVEVVHAMTTNESFFFRDKIPFDHFRDTIMPELLAARAAERR